MNFCTMLNILSIFICYVSQGTPVLGVDITSEDIGSRNGYNLRVFYC